MIPKQLVVSYSPSLKDEVRVNSQPGAGELVSDAPGTELELDDELLLELDVMMGEGAVVGVILV